MEQWKCEICNRDERFENSWLHHVASLGHQRALTRRPGGGKGHWDESPDYRLRAITLAGCNKIIATPQDLANYVTNWGRLEEFICPTSLTGTKPEEVYCLFCKEESVKKILNQKEHQIGRQPLKITRKYATDQVEEPEQSVAENKEESENEPNGNGNGVSNGEKSSEFEYDPVPAEPEDFSTWSEMKLEMQLRKLFDMISISMDERAKRIKITKQIQDVLRKTFSNCTVFAYGTDSLGIATREDSCRLLVDPYSILGAKKNGVIDAKGDQMSPNLIFQILSTYKEKDKNVFKFVSMCSISPVAAFTIPEISLTIGDTSCKLRFENFISLQKSRLVKFLVGHDLRVWPLIMLLRHWSHSHKTLNSLTEGEDFEGHILTLLLLFQLTKGKVIPTVTHLQGLSSTPLVINQIDVNFYSDVKLVPPAKVQFMDDESIRALSTLALLAEFFEYFAKLDFKENVICPALGKLIPRKHFRPQMERELPEEIKDKYRFTSNGDIRVQKLSICSSMCIQDPLDLTENVARGVDEMDLSDFQEKCKLGAKTVRKCLEDQNPNIMSLFHSNLNTTTMEEDSEKNTHFDPKKATTPLRTKRFFTLLDPNGNTEDLCRKLEDMEVKPKNGFNKFKLFPCGGGSKDKVTPAPEVLMEPREMLPDPPFIPTPPSISLLYNFSDAVVSNPHSDTSYRSSSRSTSSRLPRGNSDQERADRIRRWINKITPHPPDWD